MAVKIGSARMGENGKITGGKPGDQTGREVSTQNWYAHSKGWRVFRAKNAGVGCKIAECMEKICANDKIGYGSFLSYERGADGTPVIDEAQARIVRQIYGMFLDGQTPSSIAAALTKQSVPTPTDRTNWQSSTVKSILTNEKYKGDALLQKTITVDFLSKAHKVNEGEAPQFFMENSHPAIISREIYDLVQLELQRRGKRSHHTSAKSIFSDRLICGECGATFGSKVWHSTDPYRKAIWRCNQKYTRKDEKCPNRHLNEEKIKDAFVTAVNQLVIQRNEIFATYDEILAGLTDANLKLI